MTETDALRIMSALAQPTRLRVVAMLARVPDVGMSSSDVADAVGIPRNLMSSHLAVLSRAGLVVPDRHGRAVTYRFQADAIEALTSYLAELPQGA